MGNKPGTLGTTRAIGKFKRLRKAKQEEAETNEAWLPDLQGWAENVGIGNFVRKHPNFNPDSTVTIHDYHNRKILRFAFIINPENSLSVLHWINEQLSPLLTDLGNEYPQFGIDPDFVFTGPEMWRLWLECYLLLQLDWKNGGALSKQIPPPPPLPPPPADAPPSPSSTVSTASSLSSIRGSDPDHMFDDDAGSDDSVPRLSLNEFIGVTGLEDMGPPSTSVDT